MDKVYLLGVVESQKKELEALSDENIRNCELIDELRTQKTNRKIKYIAQKEELEANKKEITSLKFQIKHLLSDLYCDDCQKDLNHCKC